MRSYAPTWKPRSNARGRRSSVTRTIFDRENKSGPFFGFWWGNTFGKDYFLREGKQTTNLASINLTKLSNFPVPLPPVAEQQRIAAEVERCLSVIEELEVAAEANVKRAERFRQSILGRAFTGRLLPKNAYARFGVAADLPIAAEGENIYGGK